MSLLCWLFGHRFEEGIVMCEDHDTNLRRIKATREFKVCMRCKCLIASRWII